MASTNDVIFPESMANFLANLVDICFTRLPRHRRQRGHHQSTVQNRSVEEIPPTHS
jgi:hypothetical protein